MWYGEIWQPQINGEVTTGNGPQPPPSHRTGTGHNVSDRGDQFGERRETVGGDLQRLGPGLLPRSSRRRRSEFPG